MDDLDHSMHISDHDWLSFFEESEECGLLHVSLACPDSSGLSDADDPDFTTQTYTAIKEHHAGGDSKVPVVQEEEDSIVQCSSGVDSKGESNPKSEPEPVFKDALGGDCRIWAEKEHWFVSVYDKPSQKLVPATVPMVKKKSKQKKICKMNCARKDELKYCDQVKLSEQKFSDTDAEILETDNNTTSHEYSSDHLDIENTVESITVKCDTNQVKSTDTIFTQEICSGSAQIQQKSDIIWITGSSASEPREIKYDTCNEITKCIKISDTMFVEEKDRDASSESSQTQVAMDLTCLHESSINHLDICNSTKVKNSTCVKFDITKQISDSECTLEESDKRFQTEANVEITHLEDSSNEEKMQNTVIKNAKTDATTNLDAINQTRNSDSGGIEEECSKINNLTCFRASCKENSLELISGNGFEPGVDSSKYTDNPNTSQTNSVESDEFADYESFSSCSYDSETYHSATESVENPRYFCMQNSPCHLSQSINDDSSIDGGMHFASRCFKQDGGQSLIETSQIFPLANHSADNPSNDNSTCSTSTDGTKLCMSVYTPPSADNSSTYLGEQSESSPQLDVTMESPEAYAKATGSSQPVYAISAFWNEMEKLTINDILQIRMGRCMLPIEEAIISDDENTTCGDNASTNKVSAVRLPDSPISNTLDTADSDYCTNLDVFNPDRSSWDFSASDYEEEYWQFINSSRNSSPDQHDKSYQSECTDYVCTSEESDKTGTPVPSEDFTPIMCLIDEQYQISFSKVFDYLFDDNKTKCEAIPVSVYGLQGSYASPMNEYTFCTVTNDLSVMPCIEEPIPIFSCSHPTVRELTFPKPGCSFLGTNYTIMKNVSPIQIVSQSILGGMDCKHTDQSYCFSQDLSSLYSIKKICFLDNGSDVWRYEDDDEEMPVYSQSIFSMIKQSDMCLVCIAFASWVLRSSDPEAADAWKAALLANVSALSAIQYLRQYMKRKTSPQEDR
uniref:PGC-1 and ERR-induced regulator in muscle protein 1 n=1 Tax=Periophthalmus magnuspinnatus TaxID=409849 RepID=A0A3B3ZNU0_9GOBI